MNLVAPNLLLNPLSYYYYYQIQFIKGNSTVLGFEVQENVTNTSIVLTKPFSLGNGNESDSEVYSAPNILQRILSLLRNVRPGSDLTRFQVSFISQPFYRRIFFIKYWLK